MKIALCPGHHKDAKGAVNKKHGLNEHDEACKIIPLVEEILRDKGHSVSVFHGRLSQKIAAINTGNFDLAIDLHFNGGGGRGCEVMYVPGSTTRKGQAGLMSKEIALYMNLRDRGPQEGWYWKGENPGMYPDAFLIKTKCAAFIPEPLFIDNDGEVEKWFVAGRHEQLAEAIVLGLEAVL